MFPDSLTAQVLSRAAIDQEITAFAGCDPPSFTTSLAAKIFIKHVRSV
jgi:hypothetical protein